MRLDGFVSSARLPLVALVVLALTPSIDAQRTVKPVPHGKNWVAITGKPLGATTGQ